ncbi:hypothetical protein JKP88DRAFT_96687 [Tribonema minus]|uniref:Secreted protein n=1 Tax=Tribonema minus TaxID=303371 RepID=A0A835YHR2_9STRA|nr:hypothetical protein JKP88DRAFT_96687 [Tribonema minus]
MAVAWAAFCTHAAAGAQVIDVVATPCPDIGPLCFQFPSCRRIAWAAILKFDFEASVPQGVELHVAAGELQTMQTARQQHRVAKAAPNCVAVAL